MVKEKENTENKKQRAYNAPSEQLCWNCKRCTNAPGFECSWAAESKPVKGWTVTGEKEYFYTCGKNNKKYSLGMSYDITECPLFIKDREFTDYREEMQEISKVLDVSEGYLSTSTAKEKLFDRYERITGRKVPYYVRYHAEERGDKIDL